MSESVGAKIKRSEKCFDEHYSNLSPDQILSTYSLRKVGWLLSFVRVSSEGKHLAVFENGGKYATVDHLGEINFDPKISLRKP